MKLHLGCGKRYLPDWIHIDLGDYPHIDYHRDITDLEIFTDGTVDEIYCSHVLEHIPRKQVFDALIEWHRVLKVGGTLRLAVPNFEAIVQHYTKSGSLHELMGLLYGGQRNEYDYHYIAFDEPLLRNLLTTAGFRNIEEYAWQDFLPEDYDDISKAYLPHNDTTNGLLMSLNMTAVKLAEPALPGKTLQYVMGTWRPWN